MCSQKTGKVSIHAEDTHIRLRILTNYLVPNTTEDLDKHLDI